MTSSLSNPSAEQQNAEFEGGTPWMGKAEHPSQWCWDEVTTAHPRALQKAQGVISYAGPVAISRIQEGYKT